MKKIFAMLIVAIVIIASLTACSSFDAAPQPPQGITVNEKDFEIINPEKLTSEKQNALEKLKENKGYIYWQEDGDFYIAIFAGEKPTAGYRLEVISIEDNEGKTNILIDVVPPQNSAQIITYPYIVVKTTGITDNFDIKDMQGEAYKMLYVK